MSVDSRITGPEQVGYEKFKITVSVSVQVNCDVRRQLGNMLDSPWQHSCEFSRVFGRKALCISTVHVVDKNLEHHTRHLQSG